LSTIRRLSKESQSRDSDLLVQLGGDDVLCVVEAMLRRENSTRDIAVALWLFHAWYAAVMLGVPRSELRPNIVPGIEAAIEPYRPMILGHLARRRTINAYEYMRSQLEAREASSRMIGVIPIPMVLGNYWSVRRLFMQEFGAATAASVENQALLSAIKVAAFCTLQSLAPDFRPQRAHEFVAGIREDPDWFLASEVDLAYRLKDFGYAKQLIMDPGTFNQSGWQLEHLFAYGEILARPNWKTADAPLHYIPAAVSKALKNQLRADRREQINARRAGLVRIEPVADGEDDPQKQVIDPRGYFEDEIMAQHDLERIFDDASLPPHLRTIVVAKYRKRAVDRLEDTPLLSDWPKRRIASANQLLKPNEKWGARLRGSESVRLYATTPRSSRFGSGQRQIPAHARSLVARNAKREPATELSRECSQESKSRSEFLDARTESVFGKKLQKFAKSRFSSQVMTPEHGAAGEVRILVQNGELTAAGAAANIKFRT
jgi:hypothetical protein